MKIELTTKEIEVLQDAVAAFDLKDPGNVVRQNAFRAVKQIINRVDSITIETL